MASAQCRDTIMVAENYSHAKIYLEKGGDRNFRRFAIQKLLRLAYIVPIDPTLKHHTDPIRIPLCDLKKSHISCDALVYLHNTYHS